MNCKLNLQLWLSSVFLLTCWFRFSNLSGFQYKITIFNLIENKNESPHILILWGSAELKHWKENELMFKAHLLFIRQWNTKQRHLKLPVNSHMTHNTQSRMRSYLGQTTDKWKDFKSCMLSRENGTKCLNKGTTNHTQKNRKIKSQVVSNSEYRCRYLHLLLY